jgi:predicted RND superfamily exporter protein
MSAFLISMVLVPFGMMLVRKPVPAAGFKAPVQFNAFLKSIAGFDLRHPRWIIAFGLTVALFMATGIFRIRTESSMIKYLKPGSTLRRDAEFLDRQLMGISSAEVMITGSPDEFKQPENLRKMEELQKLAETYPAVAVTHSLADYLKLIYRALNHDDSLYFRIPDTREMVAQSLLLYEMSGGEDLDEYVTMEYDKVRIGIRTRQMDQEQRKSLLDTLHAFVKRNFPGCTLAVTGFDTLVYETTNRIIQTEIQSISIALAVILVIMCFLFGLKGGLVSIVPNLFPILFLLGLMGYGGFSLNLATAIIASIAIGIVVDDTIHYFYHYRHELRDLGDRQKALVHAHRKVGSALCFTTVCLILGFGIFLFSDTFILINYGLLSGIVVVVALLGDLFLGPALLLNLKVFKK